MNAIERKPIIALLYDFDRTLCTTDMQNYSFIPSLKIKPDEFWNETNKLAHNNGMDGQLAYMYLMLQMSRRKNLPITRDAFVAMGKGIRFFPGVEEWFPRINAFGLQNGVEIQHYVISSGNKEIIEGSSIAKYFKAIFACEFLYDQNGEAVWPKSAVNYTTKTQFLFRVCKGELDISDSRRLNESVPDSEKPIPFRDMVYIADGLTDVPCMKLVREKGGVSIAVYGKGKKPVAKQLFQDGRVDFLTPADYREKGAFDTIIKNEIKKMAICDSLADIRKTQEEEM
ncbi:MAG: haloacid dehalogenase-like hydrolase [Bacilli bacterium]|jgi:hypothetical protein|nr:haloacid dehalogenase-like hydrolase [Bacilli bacterium]